MATITTRSGKGSPLTNAEVDANFTNLNSDKVELADLSVSTVSASGGGSLSYSNTTGVFSFAPSDTSNFLSTTAIGTSVLAYDANLQSFVSAFTLPTTDGSNGQVLTTDGAGNLSFADASGGIADIVEDTTPQLGGNLLTNGNNIDVEGTGANPAEVRFYEAPDNGSNYAAIRANTLLFNSYTLTLPVSAGANGQVLSTDGTGQLFFTTPAAGYDNSDVDAHLNQSTAATNEVLSWNGSDYDWVAQSAGSVDYINAASFDTGTGVLSLTGEGSAGASVDLDGRYQLAGTYNTVIGTDTDIDTSGSTIIDNIVVTDGVITSMGTRDLTASDIGALSTSVANQNLNTTNSPTFAGLNINGSIDDVGAIFLENAIYHSGDTNTYMQFHNQDQWRVVAGGAERLEVNANNVIVNGSLVLSGDYISLGGTGRILGIDTVSSNTDAANKLYVDNAVAGAGGISNVVEDTSPQLGGNLDLNSNYIGHANAHMKAYDVGTGSSFEVTMQGYTAFSIYANPGSSIANVTISDDLTVSGGDITLGATGRIQGIDTVSSDTDAANKLYVDNAVAGVGGGISNVVEDTTPQLGGNLDIGSNYVGIPNSNFTVQDFGTGGYFTVSMFGGDIIQAFSSPGPSSQSVTITADVEIRDFKTLRFQYPNSKISRHSSDGVTEVVQPWSTPQSTLTVDVGSNSDSNIQWITADLSGNVTLNINGISSPSDRERSVNTISVMAKMGSTGYIVNTVNVDGTNHGINWAGGSAPTPTTNAYNLFTFTVFWDLIQGEIEVFGSHQGF